jgi:uncharacterized SAM-binding protein YcdF (DUF218 family)
LFPALLIITTLGVLRWRGGRRPRYLVPAAILLFLFCWMPVSMLLMRALQAAYKREPPPAGDAGAIVILAGAVHEPFAPLSFPLPGANTYERCRYGSWYYHHVAHLPVLLSGGRLDASGQPFAQSMKQVVVSNNIPESLVWIEDRAGSTAENALYSAEILRANGVHKIVLVTDATHMRRAEKCFRKLGFSVIPAPCGFKPVYRFDLNDAWPSWMAITWNEEVIHEFLGLAWYWANGKI